MRVLVFNLAVSLKDFLDDRLIETPIKITSLARGVVRGWIQRTLPYAVDIKRLTDEIRKTGYVLEYRVAQDLKLTDWTVISNKYYVDDSEETVRRLISSLTR